MEHPFSGSWGYQTSGYYAPTSRFGSPDDFRAFVERLHGAGIGVILDWVPAHFPKDAFALARFDGTALYEHEDPRRGDHPDWGTLDLQLRPQRGAQLSARQRAPTGCKEFHLDGLRVDAVASMLYPTTPAPASGCRTSTAAARISRQSHCSTSSTGGPRASPGRDHGRGRVDRVAAASATPPHDGGLGFGFKWNMGWMHDTLDYFRRPALSNGNHDAANVRWSMPSTKTSFCRSRMTKWCTGRARCSTRCRATAGRSLPTCVPSTATCGRIRARSYSSWAASLPEQETNTTAASTGTSSRTRAMQIQRARP